MIISRRVRDLTTLDISEDAIMVVACDSIGAIGSKELDYIKVPGYFVGRAAVKVPLMEVLAAGADVVGVFNNLTVEMDPAGKEIIEGVIQELNTLGIQGEKILNGSTEENIPTRQTGIGIVVLGIVRREALNIGNAQRGNLVINLGLPKVGEEVQRGGPDDPQVATPRLIKQLQKSSLVKEMLPVGSKGILHECQQLAKDASLEFNLFENLALDVKKSAGPSTCLLVVIDSNELDSFKDLQLDIPWEIVGILK